MLYALILLGKGDGVKREMKVGHVHPGIFGDFGVATSVLVKCPFLLIKILSWLDEHDPR